MKQRTLGLGTVAGLMLSSSATASVLINEFAANPPGGDPATTFVELLGTPGESFTGNLVFLESDPGTSNPGDVNNFFAASGTFDANGLLSVEIDDPENPAFTLVLTDSFTGDGETDVDANNDGTPDDLSAFGTIFDAIGVPDDSVNDALLFGDDLGGSDIAFNGVFEALSVFRDSITGDLFNTVTINFGDPDEAIAVFDAAGNAVDVSLFNIDPTVTTFGSVNPNLVPEPASLLLIGLGGLTILGRRRRQA
ncbi:MAG: PEP-CTERM sorting domain-containing protein [Planctomycetota bacterium]